MSISVQQTQTLNLFGDGSSASFTFDLKTPPFSFEIGQPDSVVIDVSYRGPQIAPPPSSWQAFFSYSTGVVVSIPDVSVPSLALQALVGGTSGGGQAFSPVAPVLGQQIQDGNVTWVVIYSPQYDTIPVTVSLKKTTLTLSFSRPPRLFNSLVGINVIQAYQIPLDFVYNG